MKISGKKINPPKPLKVIIYREDEKIEFLCGAILSYDEFEQICPAPKAPLVTNPKTGISTHDTRDKKYIARVDEWSDQRVAWMIITSLSTTPDLEWEKVNRMNPSTWTSYKDELAEFLTESEINKVVGGALEANSPTEKRRSEAMENFTPSQSENQITSSQADEPTITSSTEPVNA